MIIPYTLSRDIPILNKKNSIYYFDLLVAFIFFADALMIYIPHFMLDYKYFSDLNTSLTKEKFVSSPIIQISLTASIFSASPYIIEYFTDLFDNKNSKTNIRSGSIIDSQLFWLIFLMIIPDFYILAFGIPYKTINFIVALFLSRDTVILYFYLRSVINICGGAWNRYAYITIGIPGAIGNMFYNISFLSCSQSTLQFLNIVLACGYIALIFVFILTVVWLYNNRAIYGSDEYILSATYLLGFNTYMIFSWTGDFYSNRSTDSPPVLGVGYFSAYIFIVSTGFFAIYFIAYKQFREKNLRAMHTILEGKKAFIRTVSHELRTPLNAANIGLELLQIDEPNQPVISEVQLSLQAALEILNEILTFDKVESNSLVANIVGFPISSLLRTVALFSSQATMKGVVFSHQIEEDIAKLRGYQVIGDEYKLKQVVRNLISNAIKFTPSGGIVTISVSPHSDIVLPSDSSVHEREEGYTWLKIAVTDTGPGISVQNQAQLFTSVVQFHPEKMQGGGGSGLGLYISKKIMDIHGGLLSVYSKGEGSGSSFEMVIGIQRVQDEEAASFLANISQKSFSDPNLTDLSHISIVGDPSHDIRSDQKDHVDAAVAINSGAGGSGRGSGASPSPSPSLSLCTAAPDMFDITVLVVDDSDVNRKMMSRLVRKRCRTVFEAENGLQALNLICADMESGEHKIKAVLTDNQMPVMVGTESIQEMLKRGYKGRIAIITGDVLQEDSKKLRECGAECVFYKPVPAEQIFQWLNSVYCDCDISSDKIVCSFNDKGILK